MKKVMAFVVLAAGVSLLFAGCGSNKSSTEACKHQVSLDLDHANYDAVIASSCVDKMSLGAAYFGKAGFDVSTVINNFSMTGASSSSTGTAGGSDLATYMTALVPNPSGASLNYMDLAVNAYSSVTTTAGYSTDNVKDAKFYTSLVDTVKGLSLISIVMPDLALDANGNATCDKNNNKTPDDADATACVLIAASNISTGTTLTCPGSTYAPVTPTNISLKTLSTGATVTGTYAGLTITMTTAAGGIVTGCTTTGTVANPTSTTYKRLLYRDSLGKYWSATTGSDTCVNTTNATDKWPCPLLDANGQPLDLVTEINDALSSAVTSLASSLTSSQTGTMSSSDVQAAITDVQNQACTTSCSTVCPGASCPGSCTTPYNTHNYCTSQDLAQYLQTL